MGTTAANLSAILALPFPTEEGAATVVSFRSNMQAVSVTSRSIMALSMVATLASLTGCSAVERVPSRVVTVTADPSAAPTTAAPSRLSEAPVPAGAAQIPAESRSYNDSPLPDGTASSEVGADEYGARLMACPNGGLRVYGCRDAPPPGYGPHSKAPTPPPVRTPELMPVPSDAAPMHRPPDLSGRKPPAAPPAPPKPPAPKPPAAKPPAAPPVAPPAPPATP